MTFFSGGTDTTSHFQQMTIYYLAVDERIQKRLREQIDQHIKSDEDITAENLKKIVYLDWVMNETTRYYGPGNGIFMRKVIKEHHLATMPISKDVVFMTQPMGSHYNERFYKDPQEFRPERWEN